MRDIRFIDERLAAIANSGDNSFNRITVATKEEQDAIRASLSRIEKSFPAIIDSLHFSTCAGKALGLARVRDDGKLFTVSINVKELFALEKMGDSFSLDKRIDYVLSHELGHVLDRNAAAIDKSDKVNYPTLKGGAWGEISELA
jgi:hypothetical protein